MSENVTRWLLAADEARRAHDKDRDYYCCTCLDDLPDMLRDAVAEITRLESLYRFEQERADEMTAQATVLSLDPDWPKPRVEIFTHCTAPLGDVCGRPLPCERHMR